MIAGFDQAVVGMTAGESRTTKIPVELAYGPRRDNMITTMDRSQLPKEAVPQKGQRLELTQADDSVILVTITEVSDTTITIDGNHPLAGKPLIFDIELIGIL